MTAWIKDFYAAGDAGQITEAVSYFTPDVRLQFGSNPATNTLDEARASFEALTHSITSLTHSFIGIWDVEPGITVLEVSVEYVRLDGSSITLPATTIIRHTDEKISDMRVYMDINPLFTGAS